MKIIFDFLFFPGFLFTAIVGLLLTWVDRKISAIIQWRVGPPWYQPFADLFKLLIKETIIPEGAIKFLFLGAPILSVTAATIISVMLWTMNFAPRTSFVGDLIVILYLLALIPIATILGGSASRNPLSAVGVSREMSLYFGYELPFLLALVVPILKTNGSIRIGDILLFQQAHQPFLYSISGAIATIICLICFQAKLGYAPFDIPEAEQEIMAGPYLEYSGVGLALFKLSRAMMLFILPVFIITLFWGGITNYWAILKFLLIIILIVLIKNTNPRLRIEQALRLFWARLSIISAIGLILAAFGY